MSDVVGNVEDDFVNKQFLCENRRLLRCWFSLSVTPRPQYVPRASVSEGLRREHRVRYSSIYPS